MSKSLLEGITSAYLEAETDSERIRVLFAYGTTACKEVEANHKKITELEDQLKKLNTQRITEPATYPPATRPEIKENPAPKQSLNVSPVDILSTFISTHPFWFCMSLALSLFSIGIILLLAFGRITIAEICQGIRLILKK